MAGVASQQQPTLQPVSRSWPRPALAWPGSPCKRDGLVELGPSARPGSIHFGCFPAARSSSGTSPASISSQRSVNQNEPSLLSLSSSCPGLVKPLWSPCGACDKGSRRRRPQHAAQAAGLGPRPARVAKAQVRPLSRGCPCSSVMPAVSRHHRHGQIADRAGCSRGS